MKIRNIDLIGIMNTLNYFSTNKLPQKISFAIMRNIIGLQDDLTSYSSSFNKIVESYTDFIVRDENGEYKRDANGVPIVDDEHSSDFAEEIAELLNIEIEVQLYQIDISAFDYEDCDKYDTLSAKDILALQQILCVKDGDVK